MIAVDSRPAKGDWESDLSLVSQVFEAEKACYILYRAQQDEWVIFCYVPDKSKVKDKMLYASSRSNLRQQLGSNFFKDEIFGTVPVFRKFLTLFNFKISFFKKKIKRTILTKKDINNMFIPKKLMLLLLKEKPKKKMKYTLILKCFLKKYF